MKIRVPWSRKERQRVRRRRGWKWRVRAKNEQPRRKKTMAVRDLSQRYGWEKGWFEAPRARMMVLPRGC